MTTLSLHKPLISVLMPIYNGGSYLTPAIQSILNQTISNFELICINDGSTDNSQRVLKSFAKADKRIKILTNPANIGLAASLNRAIPHTKGQYIARMDADDISLPHRFASQIKLLKSNSNLVAVGGQEEIINEHGAVVATKFFPTDPNTCYQTLANFMPIQPPLLMIRGDIFRQLRYNSAICPQDDINIYFQLLQFGQISNVDDIIFQYRQISSSLTHSKAKKVYFMALRNRLDGIINHGYRPSLLRLSLVLIETLLVIITPASALVAVFNFFRHQKSIFKTIPQFTPLLTSLLLIFTSKNR